MYDFDVNPKRRFDKCYYMSGSSAIPDDVIDCYGFIISNCCGGNKFPSSGLPTKHLENGHPWCLDNSVFTGKFKLRLWIGRMRVLLRYQRTCLFIVAPDVVGDYRATVAQFPRYAKMIRKFGYPVAFVSQDGLTPEETPWDDFDVLFVGGTDNHKLTSEAGILIDCAINKKKWVHIGRVNSTSRVRKFWRADSWDGTHIGYEPDRASRKIARAVKDVRAMKTKQHNFFDVLT